MRAIRQAALLLSLTSLTGFGLAPPRTAAAEEAEAESAAEAIAAARVKGIAFLRTKQDKDGSWGVVRGTQMYSGASGRGYEHPLGPTALALHALLVAGVLKDDPAVKKGFACLARGAPPDMARVGPSAYELSAQLLAVTARAKGPAGWRRTGGGVLEGGDRKQAQALIDALLAMRSSAGTQGWRYGLRPQSAVPGGHEDLSSTGLAALALFTADRCGLKVPSSVWPDLVSYAQRQQEPDGPEHERAVDDATCPTPAGGASARDHARGFAYIRSSQLGPDEGQATGGMTAAGVATIQCARLVLGTKSPKGWGAKEQAAARQSLFDGAAWLDENWSVKANPRKQTENLYCVLYFVHVADAMDLVGSARLGAHDWWTEMVESLIARQKENGGWDTDTAHNPRDVLDTCFALMFLSRPFAAPTPAK